MIIVNYERDIDVKTGAFDRRDQLLEFYPVGIQDRYYGSAFPNLYSNIAKCHEELGDVDNAKKNSELANSFTSEPSDKGPFYHGTKADLQIGDFLTAGSSSNYKPELIMNHI